MRGICENKKKPINSHHNRLSYLSSPDLCCCGCGGGGGWVVAFMFIFILSEGVLIELFGLVVPMFAGGGGMENDE